MIARVRELYQNGWLWGILLAFVALNALALAFEVYYVPLIPAVLLFVVLAIVAVDKYLLTLVFLVPLSIPLSDLTDGLSVDMYLPTEPLLAGLLLLYLLKYLMGDRVDIKVLRHPVSLAIYFHLAWMFITSLTSTDLLVSFKLLFSRMWFIAGFYLIASQLFRKEKNMHTYVWIFLTAFTIVVVYTLISHAPHGFDNQMMAHMVCRPFYRDHTSYGATFGFVLPLLIPLFMFVRRGDINTRFLMILLGILLAFATVVSYTRATWLSIIASIGIWALIKLRIRLEYLLVVVGIGVAFFFSIRTQLMVQLEQNRTTSSGELSEHVQSMSNISTDASNLERINRWSCAYRMWKDKPVFGFGPGTYQFEYGRYQRSYEKTSISTDFGNRGNAHSEYLGPLAEQGVLGLLSILLVIGTTVYTGIRVFYTAKRERIRIFGLAVLVGLVSYYFHGFLNNFLDTDKISALFWGFSAMLVAMDIYHKDTPETEAPEQQEART